MGHYSKTNFHGDIHNYAVKDLLEDISLHEHDLTESAKTQFKFHHEILHAFDLCRRTVLENPLLTTIGRHLLLDRIRKLYTDSKQFLNYVAEHPQLIDNDLPSNGPIIICGLPRTGSTLLHNLLACDPDCRAPSVTDMCINCVPPVPRSDVDEHQRRLCALIKSQSAYDHLIIRQNPISESRPSFHIDEDYNIIQQAGAVITLAYLSDLKQNSIDSWIYDNTNKTFVYEYHKAFLKMLNSVDAPKSHWVLKSPEHSFYLDALLSQYSNAKIIMTHRRLDEAVPSFCRMSWVFDHIYFDNANPIAQQTSAERSLQHMDKLIKNIMEYRNQYLINHGESNKNILDIVYDDLIVQPIETVRRIYNHFNLTWSAEFETNMKNWLEKNPQGKQGRHNYKLADFNLSREEIEVRYADYYKLFLSRSQNNWKDTIEHDIEYAHRSFA